MFSHAMGTRITAPAAVLAAAAAMGTTADAASARGHSACSSAASPHLPCRFSTPSGNTRCEWTPSSQAVACELLATGRGYRLRPAGRAKAARPALAHRGETLPTWQVIVFPKELSCHDTSTTMTCNQNYLTGFFTITAHGSRSD